MTIIMIIVMMKRIRHTVTTGRENWRFWDISKKQRYSKIYFFKPFSSCLLTWIRGSGGGGGGDRVGCRGIKRRDCFRPNCDF